MRIEWTEQAVADLDDAFAYVDDRNPEAAHRFFRGMFKAVKELVTVPVLGPLVYDLDPPGFYRHLVRGHRVCLPSLEFTMATSIFADRARQPTPEAIQHALGPRHVLWKALLGSLLEITEDAAANWAFYKKATGWLLRIQRRKFTICTVLPTPEALVVVFLLPERAVEAAREAELPEEVAQAMDAASVSKFGHAFNVLVTDDSLLDAVAKLARIKLESK